MHEIATQILKEWSNPIKCPMDLPLKGSFYFFYYFVLDNLTVMELIMCFFCFTVIYDALFKELSPLTNKSLYNTVSSLCKQIDHNC